MEANDGAESVDHYFLAAAYAWPVLEQELAVAGGVSPRTCDLYRSAVSQMLVSAQRFGRWHPCRGIEIVAPSGPMVVQVAHHGFTWGPSEFQSLNPVGQYDVPHMSHAFRSEGVGVPLVVVGKSRNPQPFTRQRREFAATALLRPVGNQQDYVLEFYDPLRVLCTTAAGTQAAIARDVSAPLAMATTQGDRQWLDDFLRPGATRFGDGLFMIEPFQPGKIPVVFVHGLLSDPQTWVDMANEVRARKDLNDGFQWWAYRYDTGEPFLKSAAVLRRQLAEIRGTYDPQRRDEALSQMVLIGHSLGGIVAKLQVTCSGNQLWQAACRQPLATVRTSERTREMLVEAFYFQYSADVARVVFIGTPHLGSTWARRPIGRLGSALVERSPEAAQQHEQLVRDNPFLFRHELQERFPTSIDQLEPASPLLQATARLPYSPNVKLHSIIGDSRTTWRGEPTDGVVPVSSARLLGVRSEVVVDANHEALHRDAASVAEVVRILREHLHESKLNCAAAVGDSNVGPASSY